MSLVLALLVLCIAPGALAASVEVAKVSKSASTIAGCKSATGTVTLTAAAPAGGVSVSLSSSTASATVPATVLVAGGALTATFPIKTTPVTTSVTATLTAALNGTSKSTSLTVRPMGVAGMTLKPTTVAGGETGWGRAQLECKAGPGPVAVNLVSLNTAVAAPTSDRIHVPFGKSEAYFSYQAADTTADSSAVFTARTSAGSTRSATLTVAPTPATTGAGGYTRPGHRGMFDTLYSSQASGLDHSLRNPGWVYLADDNPGQTGVWAVRNTGGPMVRVRLQDYVSTDIEDLAVAPCSAGASASCLFVGDTGDNSLNRSSVTVLRVAEPDLATYNGQPVPTTAITLNYPSFISRNAETLLVDDNGLPFLVTKAAGADKTGDARLYGTTSFTSQIMTGYGKVPVPLPAAPWTGRSNLVTGGDFKDGAVVLRTFDHAIEYRGAPGQALQSFVTWPKAEVPTPRDPMGEGISYGPDACGYLTAGEYVGDLWAVNCG